MGREIKRVALDFDFENKGTWPGYVGYSAFCNTCTSKVPDAKYPNECDACQDVVRCPYYYDPPAGEGWQVWENVSEGSPVSPVFATKEALIEHLTIFGTDRYSGRPLSQKAAENFVGQGWAPSGVGMRATDGSTVLMSGAEACEFTVKKEEEE